MVDTFFTVYPLMSREFKPDASKHAEISIETRFHDDTLQRRKEVPAATGGTGIHLRAEWLHSRPEDLDVVTHEAMHVVQVGNKQWSPGRLSEGIADYARAKFGVNNGPGDWTMPAYNPKQSYTDSYRVTARFLTWLDKHVKPGIVVALYQAMRGGTYSEDTWKQQTGKSVDELWQDYGKSPAL